MTGKLSAATPGLLHVMVTPAQSRCLFRLQGTSSRTPSPPQISLAGPPCPPGPHPVNPGSSGSLGGVPGVGGETPMLPVEPSVALLRVG